MHVCSKIIWRISWVQGFELIEPAKRSRIGKGRETPKRNHIIHISGRFSPLLIASDFALLLLIISGSLERLKIFPMKHIGLAVIPGYSISYQNL